MSVSEDAKVGGVSPVFSRIRPAGQDTPPQFVFRQTGLANNISGIIQQKNGGEIGHEQAIVLMPAVKLQTEVVGNLLIVDIMLLVFPRFIGDFLEQLLTEIICAADAHAIVDDILQREGLAVTPAAPEAGSCFQRERFNRPFIVFVHPVHFVIFTMNQTEGVADQAEGQHAGQLATQ